MKLFKKIIKFGNRAKGIVERGYCDICASEVSFCISGDWLRDYYHCERCRSIPRQRALVHVLQRIRPNFLSEAVIHESSPGGPSSDMLCKKAAHYSFSQYYPDVTPGQAGPNGVQCQNLECMSFPDASFDIFITQDVLEHVFDIDAAFREISRVLRPGGIHIFTVPYYNNMQASVCRAIKNLTGEIVYILPEIYHGNPVDEKGALVTWDYGLDLPQKIFGASGLFTEIYDIHDRSVGIDGEMQEVFVSRKLTK